jgi:predicted nucleic acid-binding protein
MIVIDANILAYGVLTQAEADLRRLAQAVLNGPEKVLLPALWRHEFLSVLSLQVKTRSLTLEEAEQAWTQTLALGSHAEAPVDMPRALALSAKLGVSSYDAQYLALAEGANTVLVTEDKRLRKAAGDRAVSMKEYLAAH